MDFALLENNTVVNLIWLHPMNASEFPNAVATNGLPVQIGDTYQGGKFYHNGEEVTNAFSDAQITAIKNQAVDEIKQEVQNG